MIKTVIFDLDGTLLNTLEDLKDSTNFVLASYGYPEKTQGEIKSFVGNGVSKLIERAIPNGKENLNFQECLKQFKLNYSQNMYNKTAPFEGIEDMLSDLQNNNIQTAVVSNKFDEAVKTLCEKYFAGKISIAVGESHKVRKKPAPDGILEVMKDLEANPRETIYVGDSEVDVQTAINSGLSCVGVTWGYREKSLLISEGADFIIETPAELLKLIKSIN